MTANLSILLRVGAGDLAVNQEPCPTDGGLGMEFWLAETTIAA
jgi:hypothetical protein